jgi:succinate dehydrogenase/fumarate reductase flavoprotein subunit
MAAEWVPAVTAGITAVAALGGQAIAGLFQGRNQERIEARQRRDRAAEVFAEVRAFLTDASPDRLGINASPERSPEVLTELGERRERIRIPLLTLAGSHPSPHVRRLAQQLEVEMANMLHMAGWFVSDLLRNRDSRTARDQANQHHTEALCMLDQLLDAIHEPETGRPVRGGLFSRRRELPGRAGGR